MRQQEVRQRWLPPFFFGLAVAMVAGLFWTGATGGDAVTLVILAVASIGMGGYVWRRQRRIAR
ncbi:hypothetical protein OHA21_19465 [Actinoplanes sp. NBC_00393]|uniref:hypothetical protein n=1 Tax=Actinoplanes sp. NBC_00393 TaxID=2975953 RepID=UPI002E1B94A7